MSNIPFYKTVMGRQFFEQQVPQFLKEMRLLRKANERIADALEKERAEDSKPDLGKEDKE